LLLGQNVLSRLGAWTIDNRRNVLVLAERGGGNPDAGCEHWRTAAPTCAVAALRDFFRDVRPPHDVTNLRLLASDGARATAPAAGWRGGGRRHDCAARCICAARRPAGASPERPTCARSAATLAAYPSGCARSRAQRHHRGGL